MKKTTILCGLLFVLGLASAHAQFSITYAFGSVTTTSGATDPTVVSTATGATFGSFTAVGVSANPNATGRFSFTTWGTGATTLVDTYGTLTGSLNPAQYYSVTITPQAGYTLDLTSLSFTVQRSGTGIRTYSVRSDAGGDNFSTNLSASISPTNSILSVQSGNTFFWTADANTSAQVGSTISLSGVGFTNVSTPIIFRFYGWNAEASTGTFSIDNVVFNGTANAAAVPEPATYAALLGLSALGLVAWRRNRSTR
jgi:hypothetical protein